MRTFLSLPRRFNRPSRYPLLCLLIVALVASAESGFGEDQRPKLKIASFEVVADIKKSIDATFWNAALEREAEHSITFQVLTAANITSAALKEQNSSDDLDPSDKADYLLINCSIVGAVKTTDSPHQLKATGQLVTVKNGAFRSVAIVEANYKGLDDDAVDVLVKRFWEALDQPVKALVNPPNLVGYWDFVLSYEDGVSEHYRVRLAPTDPNGGVSGDIEVISDAENELPVNEWNLPPGRKSGKLLELEWRRGRFEGSLTDPRSGFKNKVTGRILQNEQDRSELFLTSETAVNAQGLKDTTVLVALPAEYERNNWYLEEAGETDAVSPTYPPSTVPNVKMVWRSRERATLTPRGASPRDWLRIELFIVKNEWYLYYFAQDDSGAEEFLHQSTFKSKYRHDTFPLEDAGTPNVRYDVVEFPSRSIVGPDSERNVNERLWIQDTATKVFAEFTVVNTLPATYVVSFGFMDGRGAFCRIAELKTGEMCKVSTAMPAWFQPEGVLLLRAWVDDKSDGGQAYGPQLVGAVKRERKGNVDTTHYTWTIE